MDSLNSRNFAVFILTHGRAEHVLTDRTLRSMGYTGPIYYICDDQDKQLEIYQRKFKDQVIVFSKEKAKSYCDTMDNKPETNIVLFARNTCHKIANDLGLTHFLELDDDYSMFNFKKEIKGRVGNIHIKRDFDKICELYCDVLDQTGAKTICFAQEGDFIGGTNGTFYKRITRKAMNSFFCRTDRPFKFSGRINEDVNAYVGLGGRGDLFFTTMQISLLQYATQQNKGGLTDTYLENGTYVKSFYSIMTNPSCVQIMAMGRNDYRLHHRIKWNNAVPKIIEESYKKK